MKNVRIELFITIIIVALLPLWVHVVLEGESVRTTVVISTSAKRTETDIIISKLHEINITASVRRTTVNEKSVIKVLNDSISRRIASMFNQMKLPFKNSAADDSPICKSRGTLLRKFIARFPSRDKTDQRWSKFPPTADALSVAESVGFSATLGYPRHWKGRMRARYFFLGPPKTGTTFLSHCFAAAMNGNDSNLPYPAASMRWPVNETNFGEPKFLKSPSLVRRIWKRTGFRRWDCPKEFWIYPEIARYSDKCFPELSVMRFPPVEVESKNWFLYDGTPDQLMIYGVAQAVYEDLLGSPWKPTFLVIRRDIISRAFSHYLLHSELRKQWKWGEEPLKVFSDRLDEQLSVLESRPICKLMLYSPKRVLKNINLISQSLSRCMYYGNRENDVLFLPFGFIALGVKYWLHYFDASQFRFLEMSEIIKLKTSDQYMNMFESLFPDTLRNKPNCTHPSDWGETCTGPYQAARTENLCGPKSPFLTSQAWSSRAEKMGFSKGSSESLEKYRKIAGRWERCFDDLMDEKTLNQSQMRVYLAASLFGATLLTLCMLFGVTVVPVGNVGVVSFWGTLLSDPLFPGLAVINPLSHVAIMNTQTQVLHFSDNVPTIEGVNIHLEASCLFHMMPRKAVMVFEVFGFNIVKTLLVPQFEAAVREVTSAHSAAALYTAAARLQMTDTLKEELTRIVESYGIIIESTPINKLALPQLITDAIETKMQLQQEAEAMQFVLEKERQEADRKVIEAQGTATAQRIISGNTTDEMLKWNAIHATELLGASCNAQVIFLGNEGLPVVAPKNTTASSK